MPGENWDELLQRAARTAKSVFSRAGAPLRVAPEWFHDHEVAASLFLVDQVAGKIRINRLLVELWFGQLPKDRALDRFLALVFRASSALLFSPPAAEWTEAAERHIRAEQDLGLNETYGLAFHAAHRILENHRLDKRLLELVPDAGTAMAELVRLDVEAHPAFDVYPRAAIVMGRPHLPEELVQPAFDEFVAAFDVGEADALTETIGAYVVLDAHDVDGMVERTAKLVFQAFPEAMGLGRLDEDELTSEDVWEFQGRLPGDGSTNWCGVERFLAIALANFTGEAGLDYGDALLIGLGDDALGGPRIGLWARSGGVSADMVDIPLIAGAAGPLLGRGWEVFENAPESLHKEVPGDSVRELAHEIVWILPVLAMIFSPAGLSIWGRGPVVRAAAEVGWSWDDIE